MQKPWERSPSSFYRIEVSVRIDRPLQPETLADIHIDGQDVVHYVSALVFIAADGLSASRKVRGFPHNVTFPFRRRLPVELLESPDVTNRLPLKTWRNNGALWLELDDHTFKAALSGDLVLDAERQLGLE